MASKFSPKAKKVKKSKGGGKPLTDSQKGSIDWGNSASTADRYGGYVPRPR